MVKKSVKTIVFLLLFLILFLSITDVLCPKWFSGCHETHVTEQFYDMEKNSAQVCILGSSQIVYGLSSLEMYDKYGISAFSIGTANQSLLASYHWLKEVRKTQDVGYVIFDVSMLFEEDDESIVRKSFDTMRPSLNKLAAIWQHSRLEISDPFPTYLFKIIRYHTRWEDLDEKDFKLSIDMEASKVHRGGVISTSLRLVDYDQLIIDHDEYEDSLQMVDYQLEYFYKLAEYCDENGIELLLIKTPKDNWSRTKSELTQKVADGLGLTYLDFNTDENLQAFGFDPAEDMKDPDHLNFRGCIKLSDYLGAYLKEHYGLEDCTGNGDISEEEDALYAIDRENGLLKTAYDAGDYLSRLAGSRYDVVISVSAGVGEAWTPQLQQVLASYGLTADLSRITGENYVAHLQGGTAVSETLSAEPIEYNFTTMDGTAGTVRSINGSAESLPYLIGGDAKQFKQNGINILVYDNGRGERVEDATLYFDSGLGCMRVKR